MKYETKEAFEAANAFGTGEPNTAYARFFQGDSFLNPLTDPKSGLFAANVTFAPGCRNNWTSTMPPRAADSCCCVPPARAGIRRRASPLFPSMRAAW